MDNGWHPGQPARTSGGAQQDKYLRELMHCWMSWVFPAGSFDVRGVLHPNILHRSKQAHYHRGLLYQISNATITILKMEILTSYNLIIEASYHHHTVIYLQRGGDERQRAFRAYADRFGHFVEIGTGRIRFGSIDFFPILELLGIVGLIMIVLEAALELELKPEKILPIGKGAYHCAHQPDAPPGSRAHPASVH